MTEADFIAALRLLPLHPGAAALRDDAARLGDLVVTTDTMVAGVHFLASDPPADVAWKLVAVNLSDLAAKGATPEGVLLNYPISDDDWDRAFLTGLAEALTTFDCPLIGGDTVSLPGDAPRFLTLTAIGRACAHMPLRSGAQPGDALYVTGTIGDAGLGLALLQGRIAASSHADTLALTQAYRRPHPCLAEGQALAPHVHAMMDVSDGLLIDASRMADASGLAATVDLSAIPLSTAAITVGGGDPAARLAAATAGDDYQLLFAAPAELALPVQATRIGSFARGAGLTLTDDGDPVPLPPRLGYQHGT